MIDQQLQADWMNDLVESLIGGRPFVPGPREPEFGVGDFIGVITPSLGLGLQRAGLWDVEGFQVKFVGKERDRARTNQVMSLVDRELIEMDVPLSLWGSWITSVDRAGSPPTQLQEDEHLRIAWVCTYFAEVAR